MPIDPNIARGGAVLGAGLPEYLNALRQQDLQERTANNQNALFDFQFGNMQKDDQRKDALNALAQDHPNATAADYIKTGGIGGAEAYNTIAAAGAQSNQYQLLQQSHKLQQVKYWADVVSQDPTRHGEAEQAMAALGIQGHPSDGMPPEQIAAQAKQASASLQQQLDSIDAQLVKPDDRFRAGNERAIETMKEGSAQKINANTQAHEDKRAQFVQGQENARSLKQILGPDGQPTWVTSQEAQGKPAYNASAFGAANLSDQALQFAADTYRNTGKMPTSFGRSPAMQAKVLNKVAADAAATGDTAGAISARSAALKANGIALDQNAKLLTNTSGYLATMDKNLDALTALQGKVDTSGSPLLNKAVRAWQQGVAGDPDVAKYVTFLSSVQGEFAKLKSGSLGNVAASDAAMKDAAEVINKYMNSGSILAVKDAMHQEGQNRVQSIKEQSDSLNAQMGAGAPGTQPASPVPAAPTPATAVGGFTEGQTATGQNGQKIMFKGGHWVPLGQ